MIDFGIITIIITQMNVTIILFPSPAYGQFFTTSYSPIYEFVHGSQHIAGFILYSATVAAFSFAAVLTMPACGQFDVVVLNLKDEKTKNLQICYF